MDSSHLVNTVDWYASALAASSRSDPVEYERHWTAMRDATTSLHIFFQQQQQMARRRRNVHRPMTLVQMRYVAQCIAMQIPYYHPLQHCYKTGHTALRGANKVLKEHYYPNYTVPRSVGGGGLHAGLHRGQAVDRQISAWAAHKGAALPRRMHPYTKKLLDAFREWGWKPLYGQFVVYDQTHGSRLGTALDLVMVDNDRRVIAIELKAGYHGYWTREQGQLAGNLAHIGSCPRNHAMLQLAMGCLLARGRATIHQAFVVRVEEDGVFREELADWAKPAVLQNMPFDKK
jgi:hypothetical protein